VESAKVYKIDVGYDEVSACGRKRVEWIWYVIWYVCNVFESLEIFIYLMSYLYTCVGCCDWCAAKTMQQGHIQWHVKDAVCPRASRLVQLIPQILEAKWVLHLYRSECSRQCESAILELSCCCNGHLLCGRQPDSSATSSICTRRCVSVCLCLCSCPICTALCRLSSVLCVHFKI
jgi:hypothetical protein